MINFPSLSGKSSRLENALRGENLKFLCHALSTVLTVVVMFRYEMRQCVKLTREIFAQPAFDQFRGPELEPGPDLTSDSQLDEFVRRKSDSAYHPSCTCKMGSTSDNMAVVDSQCRVMGLDNLRVVDSSIMPSVASGNLNAPTIMLAERAADIIKGK